MIRHIQVRQIDADASHRVIEKSKLECIGEMERTDDGTVLEWQLRNFGAPAASR